MLNRNPWTTPDFALSVMLVTAVLAALPWLERDDSRVRRTVYLVAAFLALRYCWWRASRVLEVPFDASMAFAYAYGLFELYFIYNSIRTFRSWIRFVHRHQEADDHMDWYADRASPPMVDFLIPTYNENRSVLERAIVGAMSQDFPRLRVWVLDDGKREWLRDLAAQKGAHYLTRPDNAGFKAGNLNHALKHIGALDEPSEFVAVVDCDFLARPSFVGRALALMYDESIAIVQTKQLYFNQDPFQYALSLGPWLPDWQRSAFDFGAPTRDARGAQYCCGTCFLARRSSLDLVGGVPTESVAEDRLLTFALQASGLRTIYLNEGHTYGIVAEGLREFLTQCGRWSLGIVQNLHSKWGGASPDKTLWQRLRFFEGSVLWAIMCLAKVFQLWLPILFWLFGVDLFPILGTASEYVAYFFPLWVFSLTTQWWLTRGASGLPIVGDAVTMLQASIVFRGTFRGLMKSKNLRFDVTDKGMLRDRTQVHWYSLKWLLLVGGLTVAGLVYATVDPHAPSRGAPMVGFAYFWSYYNLLSIATAVTVCIERAQRREDVRFAAHERAMVSTSERRWNVNVVDISIGGILVELGTPLEVGQEVKVGLRGSADIAARVVRQSPSRRVALRFEANDAQRAELIRRIYSENYVKPVTVGRFWQIYRAVLVNAFL